MIWNYLSRVNSNISSYVWRDYIVVVLGWIGFSDMYAQDIYIIIRIFSLSIFADDLNYLHWIFEAYIRHEECEHKKQTLSRKGEWHRQPHNMKVGSMKNIKSFEVLKYFAWWFLLVVCFCVVCGSRDKCMSNSK